MNFIAADIETGEVVETPLSVERRPTCLVIPEQTTFEEWQDIGQWLHSAERSVMWWIGDWWAFGEHRYGARKALVESEDWQGPAFQTCADAASVSRRFETSERSEVLPWSHYRQVSSLPKEQRDEILNEAEREGWSVRETRAAVNRLKNAALVPAAPRAAANDEPHGRYVTDLSKLVARGETFGCIYADPPWLYDNQGTRASTGNHYGGMTVSELCEMPIRELAAKDAHLHLWTTNAFLFDCPRIFEAWGFEFRSSFVWVKPQMGIGNYWRNSHEILLTAIRGNAKRFNDHSMMSWLECERGRHSAKPERIRHMLEKASPGPNLELFARSVPDNWTAFGNHDFGDNIFDHAKQEVA